MSIPFLVCALFTALSAFISLGFSLAALKASGGTLALYACSRSIAFATLSVIPLLNGSVQWLEVVAVGMVIVQALDAAIGVVIRDRMKTFGPAGTAVVNLIALLWFARSQ